MADRIDNAADSSDPPVQQFREELDRRFRAPLMAFFLKRVGNRTDAEDLTQEVFLKILRRSNTIDVERADSYVFTAAANLLRDRARQSTSHLEKAHVSLDNPLHLHSPQLIEDLDPERVLISKQSLDDVLAALEGLSQRTRDIFVLFRIERMRQQEIADSFGLSRSAVEKHIVKAVMHLTARFGSS
jgi:RNA polymerase sigma-70 factor (ECF subfamily)